ncbi:O-methyltransferase [Carboxylicivirga marina]|uniref:Class I SAM-dependent methyltransferase n=1 Tax=Carboxylicivirga marina TaxID=2800988 RepID=A0ABS1HFN6_9BACT|nr:class I SAM-dependent methyltransferase [Carboxylicivirga marina]MBK3516421.1 class I SAM-dependent methyltransferase [Carboxylicivirga marina]
MNWFQVKSYSKYLLSARYKMGHGLHSPFVFNLVREVINCRHQYYAFQTIDELRRKLSASEDEIEVLDYGAGSVSLNKKRRKVAALVKRSSISKRYAEILFRLIAEIKPDNIIELGTSIGISTSYLALSDKRRDVYTIEGCPQTAQVAKSTIEHLRCDNVNHLVGQFKDVLPDLAGKLQKLDFVFFDGHHTKEATIDYFNVCLPYAGNDTVFVFDDIHWSKGMEEAWDIICAHPKVTVSMDLFQLGIIFFKRECQKQHFIVRL